MISCQSVEYASKPSLSFASLAMSSFISTIIFFTGIAGAGQKNIGIPAYAMECALAINPAPISPMFIFLISINNSFF